MIEDNFIIQLSNSERIPEFLIGQFVPRDTGLWRNNHLDQRHCQGIIAVV